MTVVTEEDARARWCPHARGNGTGINRWTENGTAAGPMCIGNHCMAWRWVKGSEKASVGRGYCGLAGRP
jgi:hypothetical protein